MVNLYSGDAGSLDLDNSRNRSTLYSTIDTVVLPIYRSSRAHLLLFFNDLDGRLHDHAWRLDWNDTKSVIENVVGDIADSTVYKPSCIMHYTAQVASDSTYSSVSLNFSTFYHLWKKATSDSTVTFEDVVTETRDYCYTFDAQDYLKLLYYATLGDGDSAAGLWNTALSNNFIMAEDYDFGDMDETTVSALATDLDFGEN